MLGRVSEVRAHYPTYTFFYLFFSAHIAKLRSNFRNFPNFKDSNSYVIFPALWAGELSGI